MRPSTRWPQQQFCHQVAARTPTWICEVCLSCKSYLNIKANTGLTYGSMLTTRTRLNFLLKNTVINVLFHRCIHKYIHTYVHARNYNSNFFEVKYLKYVHVNIHAYICAYASKHLGLYIYIYLYSRPIKTVAQERQVKWKLRYTCKYRDRAKCTITAQRSLIINHKSLAWAYIQKDI